MSSDYGKRPHSSKPYSKMSGSYKQSQNNITELHFEMKRDRDPRKLNQPIKKNEDKDKKDKDKKRKDYKKDDYYSSKPQKSSYSKSYPTSKYHDGR